MTHERMSVDELLKNQTQQLPLATVEAVEGKPDLVKITPWVPGVGCLCHLSVQVAQSAVDSVAQTENTHYCCGKALRVVEVHFRPGATMPVEEVFRQLASGANIPGRTVAQSTRHSAPDWPWPGRPSMWYRPDPFSQVPHPPSPSSPSSFPARLVFGGLGAVHRHVLAYGFLVLRLVSGYLLLLLG